MKCKWCEHINTRTAFSNIFQGISFFYLFQLNNQFPWRIPIPKLPIIMPIFKLKLLSTLVSINTTPKLMWAVAICEMIIYEFQTSIFLQLGLTLASANFIGICAVGCSVSPYNVSNQLISLQHAVEASCSSLIMINVINCESLSQIDINVLSD